MSAILACIGGEEIYHQIAAGRILAESLGRKSTPFGQSSEIFKIAPQTPEDAEFFLMPRCPGGANKLKSFRTNARANLFALKDLGVTCIFSWGAGGAITHNFAVGDMVILSDLIDQTYLREQTFFTESPLGFLRQFPVFCPPLRDLLSETLGEMKLPFKTTGIAAVREGPRLETPAEVRMLAKMDAEIVTHLFVPEMFLAKELQMCYAAVCYIMNYAETGSRHHPFAAGGLFGGLRQRSDDDKLADVIDNLPDVAIRLAKKIQDATKNAKPNCECSKTMLQHIQEYDLPEDWHGWFDEQAKTK